MGVGDKLPTVVIVGSLVFAAADPKHARDVPHLPEGPHPMLVDLIGGLPRYGIATSNPMISFGPDRDL
jgi:hypothetical protein